MTFETLNRDACCYTCALMKRLFQMLFLSVALMTPLRADEQGVVVRNAAVYADASSVSRRLGKIGAGANVSIFSRRGGWKEIYSEEKSLIGWVRSYQVREGDYAPAVKTEAKSDSRGFLSGLATLSRKASSFFKTDTGSTSSGTATIGVRGLSEAEIKSAVADFEELEAMKQFASNARRATKFAGKGRLKAKKVAHITGRKK